MLQTFLTLSAVLLIQLLGLLQQSQHKILLKELPTGFLFWPLQRLCCGQDLWFLQEKAWTSLPPAPLISPDPGAEPRRADGALNPKKHPKKTRHRDKAPAAKGQPLSCWRCQGFMLEVQETGAEAVEGLTGELLPTVWFKICIITPYHSQTVIADGQRKITERRQQLVKKSHKFRISKLLSKCYVSIRKVDSIHHYYFGEITSMRISALPQ